MTLSQAILDIFEEYLESKGVVINNPERDKNPDACQLYGSEYAELQCEIESVIRYYLEKARV